MDVCMSIVVMKSSSALLADLLDKVKEAGKGERNCVVCWKSGKKVARLFSAKQAPICYCFLQKEDGSVTHLSHTSPQPLLFFHLFSGQGSIRRSLVHKVTHHILSQDLEDAVNSDGDSDKYHQLISSLSSSRNWDHSLGSVLLIPQDLISQSP